MKVFPLIISRHRRCCCRLNFNTAATATCLLPASAGLPPAGRTCCIFIYFLSLFYNEKKISLSHKHYTHLTCQNIVSCARSSYIWYTGITRAAMCTMPRTCTLYGVHTIRFTDKNPYSRLQYFFLSLLISIFMLSSILRAKSHIQVHHV